MTRKLSAEQFSEDVLAQYQAIVDTAGKDGVKRAAAVDAIATKLRADIAKGLIALPVDVEGMVERVVFVRDEQSRRSQVDHVRLVVDCIAGNTILGTDDPVMDLVTLVGAGIRKTWRYVSVEDLGAMVGVKVSHSAAAAVAAHEFQKDAQVIIHHLLTTYGVHGVIGDILP